MVDVINRGYLYFAQPPLFKVKKGKQEFYVKDESSLDDIILNNGIENVKIRKKDGEMLEGAVLINTVKSLLRMEKILDVFERKNMERLVLKAFVKEGLNPDSLSDYNKSAELAQKVLRRIETTNPELLPLSVDIAKDEEESKYCIEVLSYRNGLGRRTVVDFDLTESPSFGEIASVTRKAMSIGEPPFAIQMDDRTVEVQSFSGLVDLIIEHGRKNLNIQRYKGLGEMNAEQLWETTMNPENRKILQVAIEDAVRANEIFSTLMGDQVEPRREFIEKNALNVANLDY